MARVLESWAGSPVRVALHLYGWEIDYDGENLSIYAQPEVSRHVHKPGYLLSGTITATVTEAKERLRALSAAFGQVGIVCRLEYLIVDENGHVLQDRESGIIS
ncbi:hypothetical protein SAMN04489712_101852 [Thermomonospora echinospora]|uniref:Uncharacterized protein n=1 Tax=Thermomonospora echinospora TaxID=1992 RepID=A0A1H5U2V7_9ACTN|nr:hypothetical protein [Thermomonospora echinospora]SEF69425.1 hypothetical protein SAMN04489712_101852 [Thermomonospora echinospora]